MISLFSSLKPIKKYLTIESFNPLLISSKSFIVTYEEYPQSLIRLFNLNCLQIKYYYLPTRLVDMCYSEDFHSFIFLSQKSIYKLNPLMELIETIDDYYLLKENRSMSSICSMNDQRLFILYRFGEYLDVYPKEKRIWKRRHLCETITEDIAQIRSLKNIIGLLIVEWNGIWRVDVFSSTLHKLHRGFRFTGWTIHTRLSEYSLYQCWFVGSTHQVFINSKGQPMNILSNEKDENIINIVWIVDSDQIKIIVTQSKTHLTLFK